MDSQSPPRGQGAPDPVLARLREAAALVLWELEAVKVRPDEPFRLASGNSSPIYVNCRRLISEPGFMELFVAAARRLSRAVPDVIAGGETAGIAFAAYLASAFSRPMVYVRKKAKGYGLAARVEGHLEPGAAVLLVEDLITDGGSKLGFLDALAEAGAKVSEALVVVDRQQGGADLLARRGVALSSITDRDTMMRTGEAEGLLSPRERRSVDDYFRDPEAWHRRRGLDYQG